MLQLEIEREALKKEKDKASKERLTKIEAELEELGESLNRLKAQWQAEKEAIGRVGALKEQIEQAKSEIETAERRGDLAKAAELKYGACPNWSGKWPKWRKKPEQDENPRMLKEEVSADDVAEIVAKWTASR